MHAVGSFLSKVLIYSLALTCQFAENKRIRHHVIYIVTKNDRISFHGPRQVEQDSLSVSKVVKSALLVNNPVNCARKRVNWATRSRRGVIFPTSWQIIGF